MKKCRFHRTAHLYPFNMLSEREEKTFEVHLASCGECVRIVDEARRVKTLYRARPQHKPSMGFEQKILRTVTMKPDKQTDGLDWMSFFRFNSALFPVAVCLTIILFVSFLFIRAGEIHRKSEVISASTTNQQNMTPSDYYIKWNLRGYERDLLSDDKNAAMESYYKMRGKM
ncbi:MAG: hypothetical protein AB1546_06150 [bacterium]